MKDYSGIADETLVYLCREDDKSAWKELYGRYFNVAKAIAAKYSADYGETDDIAQEGLIGFLSAVHSYKDTKNVTFKTYAWTCIKNRIINAVKSKKSGRSVQASDCQPLYMQEDVPDLSMTPEELVISENEAQLIMNIMDEKLSDKEQTVFKMYLAGSTYSEISNALSMSVKGVDGALQRARKKLKAELDVQ